MLNTQGNNNRDLPEEIQKFMISYDEKIQYDNDKKVDNNQTNSKDKQISINHKLLDNNPHQNGNVNYLSPSKQSQQQVPLYQKVVDSPLKKNHFDDITKVIEIGNKDFKSNIFKKAENKAPENVLVNQFELSSNKKVEKKTNFFQNVYDNKQVQKSDDFQTLQLQMNSSNSSNRQILTNGHIPMSEINGRQYFTNPPQVSPFLSSITPKSNQSTRIDFRIGAPANSSILPKDEYKNQTLEREHLTSNTSSKSLHAPTLKTKYYSSENNSVFPKSHFSELRKDKSYNEVNNEYNQSDSITRSELVTKNDKLLNVGQQPRLFINSIINRPVIPNDKKVEPSQTTFIEQSHNAEIQLQKDKILEGSYLTNGNGVFTQRRNTNSMVEPVQFINASVDSKYATNTPRYQPSLSKAVTENSALESIHRNPDQLTRAENGNYNTISNTVQPLSTYKNKSNISTLKPNLTIHLDSDLDKNKTIPNSYIFTPSQTTTALNSNNAKFDFQSNEINKKTNPIEVLKEDNIFLTKSNSLHTLLPKSNLYRTTTPSEFTVGNRNNWTNDELTTESRKNDGLNENSSFRKDFTATPQRRAINSFVNYNDQDNRKYLDNFKSINSNRNMTFIETNEDIHDHFNGNSIANNTNPKRQTVPDQFGRPDLTISKHLQPLSSKFIGKPTSIPISRSQFQ
jgi:hypothetical protein